jgi:hypothetical protein
MGRTPGVMRNTVWKDGKFRFFARRSGHPEVCGGFEDEPVRRGRSSQRPCGTLGRLGER